MPGLNSIVITSDATPADDLFTGFAFSGSDLIIGPSGYEDFTHAGGAVRHHDDGCYLLAKRSGEGHVVGSDFKGNCKVFYYSDGQRWAVSNSLADLIVAARARGWPITPQLHLLETWELALPIWDMCVSYETMVAEIRLLPRWSVLRLSARGMKAEPVLRLDATESYDDYAEHLQGYVQNWLGRIGTVLADRRANVSVEVTGGLDSRAVLSLFLGARQHLGVPFDETLRFNSNTSERRSADLAVAESLARHYGFSLNTGRHAAGDSSHRFTGGQQFARWFSFALGSYRPVYEPASMVDLHGIPFGGQGGEGHRRSYAAFDDLEALLTVERAKFFKAEHFDRVRNAMETALATIAEQSPRTPPLLAHFQEFRDRHHAGLNPQFRVRAVPLTGRQLHAASRHLSSEFLLRGQTLRDIHALTAPGLLAIPYDDPHKAPSEHILRDLIRPLAVAPEPGRIYGLGDDAPVVRDAGAGAFIELFLDAYHQARRRLEDGVLQRTTLQRAQMAVSRLPADRGAPRAAALRLAHTVIFADFLTSA